MAGISSMANQVNLQITSSNVQKLMASSEVDQKYLGSFAKGCNSSNPYLSSFLYKVLGLSVLISRKLIRARRLRKLDTTRDTKSLQLYHHIIWLAREGLVMIEQYIIPMAADHVVLKILAYKLRASFYHIFVLFHNQPSVHQTAIPSFSTTSKGKAADRSSIRSSPNPFEGGPVQPLPPGLAPVSIPKSSAAFLLPSSDYIPAATHCFTEASSLADSRLGGSHPVRLSVKIEFAAYMYDCLHDGDGSRTLAKRAIKDVYNDSTGMTTEMFEDATEQVHILGKMTKRGLGGSVGSSTPRLGTGTGEESTPRLGTGTGEESTPRLGTGEGSTPRLGTAEESTGRATESELSTPRATTTKISRDEGEPEVRVNGQNGQNGRNGVSPGKRSSPLRER
ncbi:MAG: hypothetical protein Q9169_006093 [Polycauliona sp. 2 TL-2023]